MEKHTSVDGQTIRFRDLKICIRYILGLFFCHAVGVELPHLGGAGNDSCDPFFGKSAGEEETPFLVGLSNLIKGAGGVHTWQGVFSRVLGKDLRSLDRAKSLDYDLTVGKFFVDVFDAGLN